MKYQAPYGSTDPDAGYVDRDTPSATAGSRVPAAAIEDPQRELAGLILAAGLTPSDDDLLQVARAIQSGKLNYAIAGGTATALLVSLSPALLVYGPGLTMKVKVAAKPTGPATVNVNGLGIKSIVDKTGAPISDGFWQAGDILSLIYDGGGFRVVGGNTIVSTAFTSTYANPQALANGVFTQTGLTVGAASFGAVASNQFTFTRAGFYAISGQVSETITSSGATNISAGVAIKKNGNIVPGGTTQDNNYSPGSGTAIFQVGCTTVVSAVAGDVIQLFASVSANTGFTSGQYQQATLSITPIS